jgi:serine/threonine protein kinase/Tol biopolymer transport system component
MALPIGSRLGPYEIVGAIGAGGMGEVYKARDTRLDRVVAVKVIQTHVAASPEFRERFDREARAISSLDHPHICTLYDVGHESDADFLVMQFLEGETLADRLARAGKPRSDPSRPPSSSPGTLATTTTAMSRGPIALETTLKYAAEIAHALDAAHRRGIVHRDLKPGNIMITKAGTKLLDFGLAKLAAEEAGTFGVGEGATRTSPLTGQGAILGTLYYMSPEQLEGRAVDARSDIFSFGAVLYEMLTSRRAFDADSQAGTIAAIIGADPPALGDLADVRTTLPVVAHRALDRLLRRCLAKNPDDRWHSAADLADELSWINEERLRGVTEPAAASAAVPAMATASRYRERIWMAVAGMAVAALAAVAVWWYPRPVSNPTAVAFTVVAPPGESLSLGPGLQAVSPDGQRLAFTTGTGDSLRLWIRAIGSTEPRLLDRTAGAWHPFWSPDGRSVAYSGPGGATPLRRLDIEGGAPLTLAPEASGRGTWGSAGVIVFSGPDGRLYRVAETGGAPAVAVDLDAARQETSLAWPHFLPDGRRFLFLARSADRTKAAIFLASLDAPGRTHVVDAFSSVEYADGFLFYQREGTLMAQPFDESSGRITGEAIPTIEHLRYNTGNGRAAFSVSPSGVLAYCLGGDTGLNTARTITWFDRAGAALGQVGSPGPYGNALLSPDGRQLVVVDEGRQETPARTLWLVDVERGVPTRFTVGANEELNPVWTADGSSIVFRAIRRDGRTGIYQRGAGGGATSDDLLLADESAVPTGFSPDGQILLFARGSFPNQQVWSVAASGGDPVAVFPGSTTNDSLARFSPDGKWIAYTSVESARFADGQIYIQPFPADGRRIRISTTNGYDARWTADQRQIVYRTNDGGIEAVDLTPDGGTLRPSTPKRLFAARRIGALNWSFDMTPRADRFLVVVPPDRSSDEADVPITVIVNWTSTLPKQRP